MDASGAEQAQDPIVFKVTRTGSTTVTTVVNLDWSTGTVTPFDLLTFGFNPVLPAYPAAGDTWSSEQPSTDFTTYGVTGGARVLEVQTELQADRQ